MKRFGIRIRDEQSGSYSREQLKQFYWVKLLDAYPGSGIEKISEETVPTLGNPCVSRVAWSEDLLQVPQSDDEYEDEEDEVQQVEAADHKSADTNAEKSVDTTDEKSADSNAEKSVDTTDEKSADITAEKSDTTVEKPGVAAAEGVIVAATESAAAASDGQAEAAAKGREAAAKRAEEKRLAMKVWF